MRASLTSRRLRIPARLLARAAIATLAAFACHAAQAADWRYCLAAQRSEHRVYISEPFATNKSMERLQDDFAAALTRAGLHHGPVQCPRGDEQSIQIMRAQAARFNRDSGNAVVEFGRWRP